MIQKDRCVIIVKAQPHRSSKYFETVCAAGVGADGTWRRQYPVPFRILNDPQKFGRWQWIKYEFIKSDGDSRRESQKVIPESIEIDGTLKPSERSGLLAPLIRSDFAEANNAGESLTLIRPVEMDFTWNKKTESELADERQKHATLASQLSLLDNTAKALDPCPYQFFVKWKGDGGKSHRHESDDWESAAAFGRFKRLYGEEDALNKLREKYEKYLAAGLALAFSTHKRRNVTNSTSNQWLLVGLIRIDEPSTPDLFR